MKKLALLAGLTLSIVACKEKDLTDNNPALPDENIQMKTSFLYDGEGFSEDSILTNNVGNVFHITDIKFLISDLYLINKGDSSSLDTGYYKFDQKNVDKYVALLDGGGYSGFYGFRLGLDSMETVSLNPQNARGDGLLDQDLIRNDAFGYNGFVIKGRVRDPQDPLDTIGKIPFEYHIGGYYINRVLRSEMLNFSVSNTTTANFILNVDPEPIFNDFDIVATPTVTSDFSDPVDFEIAEMMMDSLRIKLF